MKQTCQMIGGGGMKTEVVQPADTGMPGSTSPPHSSLSIIADDHHE